MADYETKLIRGALACQFFWHELNIIYPKNVNLLFSLLYKYLLSDVNIELNVTY